MIVSLLGALLPCLACHLLLVACRPVSSRRTAERILSASLAIGFGLGCSSAGYFLWRLLMGTAGRIYLLADSLFWTGLVFVAAALFQWRRRRPVPDLSIPPPPERAHHMLRLSFAAMLLVTIAGAGLAWRANPQGGWDAWAIWNLRALTLYRMEGVPEQSWSAAFDHSDYPLLLPATIARAWTYLGGEADVVPATVGLLFTLATVGLLVGGIGRIRGLNHGILAGIVLLGTVRFVRWGAAQYADVPLAFFYLATILLLVEQDNKQNNNDKQPAPGLCFAGLAAALAAWTKNEGALFLVALLAVRLLVQWFRSKGTRSLREAALLTAGAAPVLLVLFLFKSQLHVSNDLIEGQAVSQTVARLTDPARHSAVLLAFVGTGFRVGNAFVIVLPICALLLGIVAREHSARRASISPLLVVVTMLAGYYMVYLTTPHDLTWHLETSLDRLLVQLTPVSVLFIFLNLRTAEEVLEIAPVESSDSVWQGTAIADYAPHGPLTTGLHVPRSRIRA